MAKRKGKKSEVKQLQEIGKRKGMIALKFALAMKRNSVPENLKE